MSGWFFDPLPRRYYRVVLIDPPWRWAGGVKGRPQHYPRMTFAQISALPIRELLHPEGGRVLTWITAPLANRIGDLHRAWRLRYSSMLPWIKLWPGEDGRFIYSGSIARGTGLEVVGNAEYVAILKAGRPQSIKGRPFPGVIHSARREHSRKPADLHAEIEARLSGPYCEIFAREQRAGWDVFGNQTSRFNAPSEGIPPSQSEGGAGARPDQGRNASRSGGADAEPANSVNVVTSAVVGEGAPTPVDPVTAAGRLAEAVVS